MVSSLRMVLQQLTFSRTFCFWQNNQTLLGERELVQRPDASGGTIELVQVGKREVRGEWRGAGVGVQQEEEYVRMINVRLSERCRGEESRPGGEKRI